MIDFVPGIHEPFSWTRGLFLKVRNCGGGSFPSGLFPHSKAVPPLWLSLKAEGKVQKGKEEEGKTQNLQSPPLWHLLPEHFRCLQRRSLPALFSSAFCLFGSQLACMFSQERRCLPRALNRNPCLFCDLLSTSWPYTRLCSDPIIINRCGYTHHDKRSFL